MPRNFFVARVKFSSEFLTICKMYKWHQEILRKFWVNKFSEKAEEMLIKFHEKFNEIWENVEETFRKFVKKLDKFLVQLLMKFSSENV